MTTIAASTLTMSMACDSMATDGSERKFEFGTKIIRIEHENFHYLLGSAGCQKSIEKFANWAVGRVDFEMTVCPLNTQNDINERSSHLILRSDGKLFNVDSLYVITPKAEPYWTIGTGSPEALGALYGGKAPDEAVAIASYIDLNTGGYVYHYSFDDAMNQPSTKWPQEIIEHPLSIPMLTEVGP